MFPADWNLPNVYLLHGDLTDEEINYLYNHPKVKTMVSFTHGEGFGRPLLEATMTGLPVIAPNWSGQLDFLDTNKCILLPGQLNKIPKSASWKDIIIPESQWFDINTEAAYKAMQYCFANNDEVKGRASDLMSDNREKFTLKNMAKKLDEILTQYMKDSPTQVSLKLPELNKVSDSDSNKIKLPKLKKVTEEV